MHRQTLISTLVRVAVLCCCARVVSATMSERQKTEVAIKLDRLVRHPGWKSMNDVTFLINPSGEVEDPVSTILEAVRSGQRVVNESNVLERHDQIRTVLMCKYGEIIFNYKCLVNELIGVCQSEERTTFDSFRRYYDCINLLLIKLHSVAPRFRCMVDALECVSSLVPQPDSTPKPGVMVAVELLADYTRTIGPTTLANFQQRHRRTADGVDLEITTIGEYISRINDEHVQPFTDQHCNVVPENRKWTAPTLVEDFEHAFSVRLIPEETTMLDYVKDIIDEYVDEILGKWFYDLGFAIGVGRTVTIRTNNVR